MKKNYCLSLRQWRMGKGSPGKLDPLIFKAGEALIQREAEFNRFRVELIVGGFIANHQLVFYKASGMQDLEASTVPGIYAIGGGGQAAMDHLNSRDQNIDCSLARSLLHVAEAMDVSRKKNPQTVGKPSHFVVIWKDGTMKRFDPSCQAMKNWRKVYRHRGSTWALQNSKAADVEVKYQMIEHDPR